MIGRHMGNGLSTRKSIAFLVSASLVIATALTLSFFAWFNYRSEWKERWESLREEQDALADQMAASLALPAWNLDHAQIGKIIESAMRHRSVYSILVRIPGEQESTEGRIRDDRWEMQATNRAPLLPGLLVSDREIQMAEKRLGSVQVTSTPRFFSESLQRSLDRKIRAIVIFDSLLVCGLYWLLWALVLRPIRLLERHAAMVSNGTKQFPALASRFFPRELENLRLSLDQMVRLLESRYEALRVSEERFSLAVRGSTDGLWDWNLVTGEAYYAPRFRELLGYGSPAEFAPNIETFRSHLHPEDRPTVSQVVQRHLENREPCDIEFRLCTRHGEYRWFRARGQAVWDEQGAAVRMAGSITDITDRKKAEEALRESEEKFATAFRACPDSMAIADLETSCYLEVNDVHEKLFGFTRAESLGRSPLQLGIIEDSRPRDAVFRLLKERGSVRNVEITARDRQGKRLAILHSAEIIRLKGRDCILRVSHDVTEQRLAEAALRDSEERLREIFSHTTDAIFLVRVEPGRRFIYEAFNPASERASGYRNEDVRGKAPEDLMPRELAGRLNANYRGCLEAGAPIRYQEELAFPAGPRIFDSLLVPIQNGQGQIYRIAGFARDVTEARQAERALRDSEERYRKVVELTPEAVAIAVDDLLVYINPAGLKMLGLSDPTSVLGRSVYDFVPKSERESTLLRRQAVAEHGLPTSPHEVTLVRLDGSTLLVESIISPFTYNGQRAIINLIRDITERRRAENQRAEALRRERRAAVDYARRLISSQEAERQRIAGELHDSLGQSLLLIKNYIEQASHSPHAAADCRERLQSASQLALQALEEVRHISRDLRPYQLDQLGFTRALDLLLESLEKSSGISCQRKLELVDDVIRGEAATNLYRVAQESFNNILKHSGARRIAVELERDVRHIRLWIEDDGRGFTKSLKGSSGLGLRNITERVRMLGGFFQVDSTPGHGTRVEVVIPFRPE